MASNKRGGGGSNMGLIVTLVFFVLSTVILGITTYLGFAELDAKEKIKQKAESDKRDADKAMEWYRFKSNVLQTYSGEAKLAKRTAAELAPEKKQLDEKTLPFGSADKEDFEAFAAQVKNYDRTMKWQGTDVPSATFQSRLADKDREITALAKQLAEARRQQADEKARADQARDDADNAKKAYDTQVAAIRKQRADDLITVSETNKRLQTELNAANVDKNASRGKIGELTAALTTLQASQKSLDAAVKDARRQAQEAKEERNEIRDQLIFLKERTGIDQKTIEAQQLDKNAVEALRNWNRDWRIVDIDRTGENLYVNLGTSDRVQPQLTFSVHEMGRDGKLNPIPKGTVEVVSTRGPKLSVVRVTSVKSKSGNPLVKGDFLFNPTWDPTSKVKVALAGVVDLNNDRTDGTAEFLRLLRRQNVEVDVYIDTSDPKAPKIVGPGVSARTRYVVMADTLDQINHEKARDAVYRTAYEGMVRQIREKAAANAVPVISMSRYLDMIGYRAPSVTSSKDR